MCKKILVTFMTILMAINLLVTAHASEVVTEEKGGQEMAEMPSLNSAAAVVVDVKTGYTIYEKNIMKKYYPASITKILTAMLVIDNCKEDDIVTFSHDAVFSIKSGESSAYADEGEQLSVLQCLYGLMVISANDVANGLAEHVSGSNEKFAELMNQKAKELGVVNSNFVNPSGLHDDNHYTCAYDMAVLGLYAYRHYSRYRELIHTTMYEVPPTNKMKETRYWRNSNKLVNEGEKFYYENCFGGKTGYTNEAGETLVSYGNINGRMIMVVTLCSPSSSGAYSDNIALYEYVRENMDAAYFENLDKLYNENLEKFAEEESNDKDEIKNETTNVVSENEDQDEGFSLWGFIVFVLKIIGFVILLFVILYAALLIRLKIHQYKRKKRRKEREQRRKMIENADDEFDEI